MAKIAQALGASTDDLLHADGASGGRSRRTCTQKAKYTFDEYEHELDAIEKQARKEKRRGVTKAEEEDYVPDEEEEAHGE